MTVNEWIEVLQNMPGYMRNYQMVLAVGHPSESTFAIADPYEPERVLVEGIGYTEAIVIGKHMSARPVTFRSMKVGRRKAIREEREKQMECFCPEGVLA